MTRSPLKAAGDVIDSAFRNAVINKIQTTNATNVDTDVAFARYFNVKNYGGTNATAIRDAGTAASAAGGGTVYFSYGTFGAVSSVRLPTITGVKFDVGAVLNVRTGATFTIRGPFEAPLSRVFSLVGTGVVVFGVGTVKEFYPQWWGAKGDGVTDDSAAIQAAINAIPTSGGVVIFPVGNYRLTTSLTVYGSHTHLLGLGVSGRLGSGVSTNLGALLQFTTAVNQDMIKVGNINGPLNDNNLAVEDVVIENLSLDGKKSLNASGRGIVGFSWAGGGIRNCTIHNFISHGIELTVATAVGAGAGCCLDIGFNTVEFNDGTGIFENGNVYDFLHDNHIEANKGHGIHLAASKTRAYDNNVLQGGKGSGAGVANSGIFVQGILHHVKGNYLEGSSFHGIRINSNKSVYSDNVVERSGVEGPTTDYVSFLIENTDNLIIGNVATDGVDPQKTKAGFQEATGATNNRFIGNYSQQMLQGTFLLLSSSSSKYKDNIGLSNQGVAAITVTASPFTYTNNDGVPEYVTIDGGTITTVVKNAITLYSFGGTAARCGVWLEPGEAIVVTYTVAPTMNKDRK